MTIYSRIISIFSSKQTQKTIGAVVRKTNTKEYEIDVRGQTCPGYLLSIDREVSKLKKSDNVFLLVSYLPCEDDVKVWCEEKGHKYVSSIRHELDFRIHIVV